MSGDAWLKDYEHCAQLGQELMEHLNERNKHSRTSSAYTKLSATIRTQSRQFNSNLQQLKQNLIRASASYHITQREVERRQTLIDTLESKEKQIEQASRGDDSSRSRLLGAGFETYSAADPWGMGEEPEQFREMDNSELQDQQQLIIREQDRGLETLSGVIGRQKQMAIDIGNEVDDQNILIDDITDHVGRTDNRIQKETRHIRIVDRKSGACCYYVMIVFLFIAIVVIIAVPYKGKP